MANKSQLTRLKRGVEGWNAWRKKNPEVAIDLTKADLAGADLTGGINSAGADLRGADLRGANLRGADLSLADLSLADLTLASLARADLIGANLSRADLTEAHLFGAQLIRARLTGANFTGAQLTGANFTAAHLNGANFTGAQLMGARLTEADLSGADLSHTDLLGADLTEADLRGAQLTEALPCGTVFGNIDLTNARGLDSCLHRGPSTIDHRTIMRSGPLPLAFLRGCGLSDWQIEAAKLNIPDLELQEVTDILYRIVNLRETRPIQFYSCFISYSSRDRPFAERLHADLQNKGVRCWFAPEDMKIGDEFRSRIDQSIHVHDRLLLILSKQSIKSPWVKKEVETAFDKEVRENRLMLFPIRVDKAVMDIIEGWPADIRRSRHIGDFTQWKDHDAYQQAFTRLLRDLKAETQEEQRKSPREG